ILAILLMVGAPRAARANACPYDIYAPDCPELKGIFVIDVLCATKPARCIAAVRAIVRNPATGNECTAVVHVTSQFCIDNDADYPDYDLVSVLNYGFFLDNIAHAKGL